LQKLNLSADEVAYVGDDVIDLPVMTKVGFD
jgi:3-deoxy-D-manno-octulosonate 8-phosphate phosphatase KdsC-like HAD superfamily phosphatase